MAEVTRHRDGYMGVGYMVLTSYAKKSDSDAKKFMSDTMANVAEDFAVVSPDDLDVFILRHSMNCDTHAAVVLAVLGEDVPVRPPLLQDDK